MPNKTTFIYGKDIISPTQTTNNTRIVPDQDATGAGLWSIINDLGFCEDPLDEIVDSINSCYLFNNIINIIP
jgi:hydrogenase maturation factor HypF (carbamoyltransferase family)